MKKYLSVLLILGTLFLLTSCENENFPVANIEEMPTGNSSDLVENNQTLDKDLTVDYDLTVMSSTMVFAQVADLVYNYTNYDKKTFKINGILEMNGEAYYIFINDAEGCCSQGLEVRLNEDIAIPEIFSDIEIKSTFIVTEEDGAPYVFLEVYEISEI